MKKVLCIGTTNIYGGVGHIMFDLCRNMDPEEFHFDFLYYELPSEEEMGIIRELGGSFYKVPRYSRNPIRFIKTITHFYKTHHYDILHVHASTAMLVLYSYPVWNRRDVKIIYHSHVKAIQGIGNRLLHRCFSRVVCRKAHRYLAVSKEAATFMFGEKQLEQVIILKNGIDLGRYEYSEPVRMQKRKELGLEEPFVIGHVGRFSHAKNHTFIINVFETIHQMDDTAKLLLVGNGEDEEKIRQLVKTRGLAGNVIFYGVTGNLQEVLCAMDCFFFPSLYEGLGIVAIEAQMNGLPVIASEQVPAEAKVTSGYVTMSLEHQSQEEWAKQILQQKEKRNKRCSNYEELRKHGYDITDVSRQLEKLYLESEG